MSPTATQALTDFVVDTTLDTIDPAAVAAVAPAVADTVGVILAGCRSEAGTSILEYARSLNGHGGSAWAGGLKSGAPAELAALVNATLAHALDYDDALPGSGHPSALVLAAALGASAVDDAKPLAGKELIEAFVIGFEVTHRTSKSLGIQHYFRGWHTTSTAGTFGATAAASKILGLDRAATNMAIGIAASLSSGIQRNFGTMTKPLHSGLAARNGVMAASLARCGYTASPEVLDGDLGFLRLYGGDSSDPSAMNLLGKPFALVEPGTALKKFPCCYAAARPIHAALELRAAHNLTADKVRKISCAVPKGGLQALIYHRPQTGLQGKFCLEYVLSAAILDGEVTLRSFTDEAVTRPEVVRLMEMVDIREEPGLRPEDPEARVSSPATGGRVEVTVTTDEDQFTTTVSEPPGGPKNRLSWADIRAKFLDCAQFGGFDQAQADEGFALLQALDQQPDVNKVLRGITA